MVVPPDNTTLENKQTLLGISVALRVYLEGGVVFPADFSTNEIWLEQFVRATELYGADSEPFPSSP